MLSSKFLLSILFFHLELVLISPQLIPYRTKQTFTYENVIHMSDLIQQSPHALSHKLESYLSVESIWNSNDVQLLHFEFDNFKLKTKSISNNSSSDSNEFILQSMPQGLQYFRKHEFYAVLENSIVTKLLLKSSKDLTLMNFHRGIASLFQFRYSNGVTLETDVLGQCNVIHQALSSTKYKKIKKQCHNWYLKMHLRHDKPLDVNVESIQEIDYSLNQEQNLNKLKSSERHIINVAAKTDAGSRIESTMKIEYLTSLETEIEQIKADNLNDVLQSIRGYDEVNIEAEIDSGVNIEKPVLKSLVKSAYSSLKDDKIGTEEMASTFLKLLPAARITSKKEFIQILKARSTKDIRNALLDLLAMTQTGDSYHAVMEILKIDNDEHFNQLERYFQTLAIGTRPQLSIIKDLYNRLKSKKLIDNTKLLDTILQTLATHCAKYSKLTVKGYDEPIIVEFRNFILYKWETCETVECGAMLIRSLQNLRDPSTIPNLLDIALNNKIPYSVAAMKALKSFPIQLFDDKVRLGLEKIFYQIPKKYDSTARIAALDIILDMKPKKEQLRNLISYLTSNDKAFEIKTYVIQKIVMISEKCPRFSSLIRDILNEKPEVNNYHIMAQKGVTTTLYRRISKHPSFNETLYSSQETYKGVLKQGTVDIVLEADKEESSVFKLGLYSRGLSSFVGDSSSNVVEEDDEQETEDPSAGMEIAVQGIQLRPLVFFSSQGELMGHVWSGTASDLTPAYQATTLLQDHEEYLILQNGMTIYARIFGAQSIDLSGQVTLSLWNRNGHVEINRNTGIAINGFITLATSFIRDQNEFLVLDEPKISLTVDCDFYTDVMMCLQLSRPESKVKHKIAKKRTLSTTNHVETKNLVNFTYKLSGSTLALNRKNNEMCNKIFL